MALFHSPSVIKSGLVLHLDAANIKSYPGSGTTWTDLSGNNNNGTLTNGPTYNSTNKGSILFDGLDDSINCGSTSLTLNNLTAMSGAVWINKVNVSSGTTADRLISKRSSAQGSGWWDFLTSSNHELQFNADFSTTDISVGTSDILILNKWYYVGWIWDGTSNASNCKIFINGVEASYSTQINGTGGRVSETSNVLKIGNADWASRPFYGRISNVQIYNRVLSAAEVRQNFEALRGRYGI